MLQTDVAIPVIMNTLKYQELSNEGLVFSTEQRGLSRGRVLEFWHFPELSTVEILKLLFFINFHTIIGIRSLPDLNGKVNIDHMYCK